ncbi:MAG: hypothetical protein EA383_02695 [Spirochaetaceae bacterium]|nr:MAG: hypothetical protein EA383_02695 [Spirochaetaceae bacterium]
MLDRYVETLNRLRIGVLILSVIAVLVGVAGVRRLDVDTDFDVFMPSDSVRMRALRSMTDSFGDSDQLLVIAEVLGPESPSERTLLNAVQDFPAISRNLERVSGVSAAPSPVPDALLELEGDALAAALEAFQEMS